jgi:hypothetical protein
MLRLLAAFFILAQYNLAVELVVRRTFDSTTLQ